ncbi:MAG TPA: hypothetical protein PLQ97_12890 [Myxococcota bacterium]|nr:hypothetical protein [Myxococcota bacterium]HQK52086.1 hypothetical protein [Myxococcota bacterium]
MIGGGASPVRESPFRVILGVALGLSVAFLLRNLEEARTLDPSLLHSLLTQGGPLAMTPYRLESFPRPLLMDPTLEFGLIGYLVVLMMAPAKWMLGTAFSPLGIALTRSFVAMMNLAGGPVLYLLARRRAIGPGTSLLLAGLYLGNPFLLDKVSWDIVGCQGTFLIAAGLALASSRPRLAIPAWLLAAGGHPVTTFGTTLWALWEARRRWRNRPGSDPGPFCIGAGLLVVLSILFFLDLFLPPLVDRYSGFSLTFAVKVGGPGPLEALPGNLASLVGILASFAFLPLAAPGWLLPAMPDGLYYLVLGPNHGSLPGTAGWLALASVAGLGRIQPWMARREWPHWTRWVVPSGDLRPMVAAVAGMLLLVANLHGDPRNQVRRLFHPPQWDGAWVPEVEALVRSIPNDPELCVVQVPLLPLAQGRCHRVVPFDAWADLMPWDRRQARFLFHVDLFDPDRFKSRWTRDHEALREDLCRLYRGGMLAVHRAAGGALFAGPPDSGGGAPPRHPQMEWLCRFQ